MASTRNYSPTSPAARKLNGRCDCSTATRSRSAARHWPKASPASPTNPARLAMSKGGSERGGELQRREDLLVQVRAQQIGLKKLTGRDSALDALVARVAPMVFAEEFDKHKLKSRTRKISKQSNGRQGGGTTRPTDPPETVREKMRRLYEELEKA